ncbi:SDR family NAD(P)-dependent oxidoreductase [Aeromicrobium senzhongii]|uniref:SDR family NAD(P)-dependent oxidoreductase n=1 Tax=Aeromicrobium senzhongii TaxID=2663859 RepID=A0ABX6SWB8_9ACTN|nr:SDR family NAD(P)-dependent oxidoreductase [Aeromicrobium senzhongii]MTB87225.1 SDR family NAD(P)-dependent oxidoreductase [Aeromicrobium senzhongii]QNL95703.1 SDR family NAD(P)-dependent oxidoreductase [Aeromicrobium senzhongii]
MEQKTIVITGASDGVGAAAAQALSDHGHRVAIVGRDPDKTRTVAEELGVPFHLADYADLAQVRRLGAELAEAYPRIDVLANNAGALTDHRTMTVDGFEKTFQVNHLAGFLLTQLLLPQLIESRATVIQTASIAARLFSDFDIDDLQNTRHDGGQRAYGNTKLENILFTRELDRRHRDQGISAAAFHPGLVGSNFAHGTKSPLNFVYHTPMVSKLFTISPERGAEQLVWLATSTPGTDWERGQYYEKKKPAKSAPEAHDGELGRRLWDESMRMVAPL